MATKVEVAQQKLEELLLALGLPKDIEIHYSGIRVSFSDDRIALLPQQILGYAILPAKEIEAK